MVKALFEYQRVVRDFDKSLASVEKRADVKRDTEYYEAHIRQIRSIDELLADHKLYRYIMKAYGLDDVAYAKGLVRKVLSDPSYASRMRDPKFRELQEAFDFSTFGKLATTVHSATVDTVKRYKKMFLEDQVGQQNAGARQGLYFHRRIDELIKDEKLNSHNWNMLLLGDKNLSKIVFSALGFPPAVQASSLDAKLRLLKKHMSFEDLTDKDRREKFIKRALANYDAANSSQSFSSGSAALAILGGASNLMSPQLLNAVNNLRAVRR